MLPSAENEWQWGHIFLIFWKNTSIAFKQVAMDSVTVNGSVDAHETVIAKILNNNQWCY